MPDHPVPTEAVYDQVVSTLVGAKLQLEVLQMRRAQGQHCPETDAAILAPLILQLADAAQVFHAWYMATHGAQEEPR